MEKEVAMASKLNAEFTKDVEISKIVTNMRKNNKIYYADDSDAHRDFGQHKGASAKVNAPLKLEQSNSSNELGSAILTIDLISTWLKYHT